MPTHPFPRAVLARDLDAIVDAFAPDAVLHSPITGRFDFRGHEQLRALYRAILDVTTDVEYTHETRDGDMLFLVLDATIGGRRMQSADVARLGPDERIREFTVFFRPLLGVTTLLATLGPELVRPASPGRARMIGAGTRPLLAMTALSDRVGERLVKPVLPS